MLGQQREQQLIADGVVIDPPLRQHNAGLVDECHVVVIFSPIDSTEHRHKQHPPSSRVVDESAVHADALMAGLVGPTSHGPS